MIRISDQVLSSKWGLSIKPPRLGKHHSGAAGKNAWVKAGRSIMKHCLLDSEAYLLSGPHSSYGDLHKTCQPNSIPALRGGVFMIFHPWLWAFSNCWLLGQGVIFLPGGRAGRLTKLGWLAHTHRHAGSIRLSGLYTIRREHKEGSGNFKGSDPEQRGHLGVDIMKIHCMHE